MEKLRPIPTRLKLRYYFSFGRVFLFLLFIAPIVFFPLSWQEWQTHHAMKKKIKVTDGEITAIWEYKEGKYLVDYVFYSNEIGQYSGRGFGDDYTYIAVGESIRVMYSPGNPDLNKATKLSISKWPLLGGYIAIALILLFLGLLIWAERTAHLALKRVETGRIVKGKQVDVQMSDGENVYYTFTYEFKGQDGSKIKKEVIGQKADSFKHREYIAVDPNNEGKTTFLRKLPKKLSNYVINTYLS